MKYFTYFAKTWQHTYISFTPSDIYDVHFIDYGKGRCVDVKNMDIISINSQYGSGGREIAQKLAKNLNISFYDKELIHLAAQESGVEQDFFDQADEQASKSLLYSIVMASHSALDSDVTLYDKLFSLHTDMIKRIAQEGPCVFVGSCADYVLREEKKVFSIFVQADCFYRMDRVVGQYGLDPAKAAEYVIKKDRQRENYYNYCTNGKWGDPSAYDLIIDSSDVDIDRAVEMITGKVAV